MNKYLNNIATVMTIVAGVAAIVGVYIQYKDDNPVIEIKSILNDKLTDLPTVDGFNAKFYYKDSLVSSLWKLNYYIVNSGDEIIIGEGNNKNIIKDDLKFYLPNNYKILELNFEQDSLPFNFAFCGNELKMNFLQWKPNESFNLVLYVEQLGEEKAPQLMTNEREIIGGSVNYTTFHNEIDQEKSIFEYLPKTIQSILKWIGYIFFGLIVIVMPIVWISELIKFGKYRKWKKSDYWMYKEWVEENVKGGIFRLHYEPEKLPKKFWKAYPYPKPEFPDNDFGSLTLGTIIVLILTLIPLLIMIKI